MVKADLGTKRVCPSCAARFYDLSKRPIECPKCSYSFEPEAMYKQRRPRQPEAAVAAPVTREAEDDEEEEVAETEDDDAIVEKVDNEPELVVGDEDGDDEVVADEADPADAGMSVVSEDAALEDIVDEDVDDEGDDTLLEEVEEDEDDVSGIIDADIEKDER